MTKLLPSPVPSVATRHVRWVALPAGPVEGDDESVKVSVFVAPRLRPRIDGPLSLHPDFDEWPRTPLDFEVEIDGIVVDSTRMDPDRPSPELWSALLPGTTPVRSYRTDRFSSLAIHSYALPKLNVWLQAVYGSIGAADELPPVDTMASLFEVANFNDDRGGSPLGPIEEALDRQMAETGGVPAAGLDHRANFVLLRRFHRSHDKSGDRRELPDPPARPDLDFHDILSLLGEHPEVLRRLGLIVDLRVARPAARSGVGQVRVRPLWEPSLPVATVSPATLVDHANFFAAPRSPSSPYGPGFVAIGRDGQFDLVQVDPDGAGIKTMAFASQLDRRSRGAGRALHRDPVPPALRSAGLQLARVDRAVNLRQTFTDAEDLDDRLTDADDSTVLGAEDVTRGFRPDIEMTHSSGWCSLVARDVAYTFPGTGLDPFTVRDEATVTTVAAGIPGDRDAGLWVGESLFLWNGWSLAAPRPGVAIAKEEAPGEGYPDQPEETVEGVPLLARPTVAPGTLPRLRFGEDYSVRLRTVDLAGNSLPVDHVDHHDDDVLETRYHRFEPIEDPALIAMAVRTPGEQIDVLVVRTSRKGGDRENTPLAYRLVYPPKTSQLMAEHHGRFDVRVRDRSILDARAYAAIVAQEANTFDRRWNPDRNDFDDVGTEDPTAPGSRYYQDPPSTSPYLPDPLARAVAVKGLPGEPRDDATRLRFDGDWPHAKPLLLELERGDEGDPASWDDDGGLRITLPPGTRRTLRVSSVPDEDDLELLGQLAWSLEIRGVDADAVRARVLDGSAPLITPERRIELVHAVRQPPPPLLGDVSAPRLAPGDTFAVLQGAIDIAWPATGRLDVLAAWSEPIDDGRPEHPPTTRTVERSPAARVPLVPADPIDPLDPHDPGPVALDVRHELGDTKHRFVSYQARATTAFREFFTRTGSFTFGDADTIELPGFGEGVVADSVAVRSTDRATTYRLGFDVELDDGVASGTGQGVLTRPSGSAVPDQVEVTWLAGPIVEDGPIVEVHVPSSARPTAPAVVDVLPAFGWDVETDGPLVTSTRRGNTFRVLLGRPWWSTGDDELLGVVCWQPPFPWLNGDLPSALVPFASQWGVDPTLTAPDAFAYRPLAPGNFPRRARDRSGDLVGVDLPLAEVPGYSVTAVGHRVTYDPDRDLYVCDIEIDAGDAYLPFVRLALVRYQPYSIPGVHLSPVVPIDFLQLAPDRSATVIERSGRLSVDLRGPSYTARAESVTGPGYAWLILEEQRYPEAGDAGWREVGRKAMSTPGTQGWWTGDIALPDTSGPLRLVIEQGERLLNRPTAQHGVPSAAELRERLVHQDIIPWPYVVT